MPLSLQLYGVDGAGNRSTLPLSRTVRADTLPPAVSVTLHRGVARAGVGTPVLGGTVRDGGGVGEMYVRVQAPDGEVSWDPVRPAGETWHYILAPQMGGIYLLRIVARDRKGNTRDVDPLW